MQNKSQRIQVDPRNIHCTKRNVSPPPPPSVHINMQLSQEENVKNLSLHLDRRLTWHKHIFAKWKQLGIPLTKKYWLLRHKTQLSKRIKLLIYKTILKPIWTWNTTLRYCFHFQQRNPRMLPIKRFVHDSGRTLVRAEYGYPKGSPITNKPLQLSVQ
jgi:hypothetical protein